MDPEPFFFSKVGFGSSFFLEGGIWIRFFSKVGSGSSFIGGVIRIRVKPSRIRKPGINCVEIKGVISYIMIPSDVDWKGEAGGK